MKKVYSADSPRAVNKRGSRFSQAGLSEFCLSLGDISLFNLQTSLYKL